ncbi:MAG: Rne/Rng family ribonuclease [Deltaproteobacteria bacterium]|nr:MAG: Rne/Rng family ribonuclease [Deltaproteobacteria bacterium]
MIRQLIINETEHETRVALLEDGTIVEVFYERGDNTEITGNIYKGRVQRVLPGMQAAFIDIGLKQAAFIHANDIVRKNDPVLEKFFNDDLNDGALEDWRQEPVVQTDSMLTIPPTPEDYPIDELLTEGQELMVHVAKSPMGSKGARVTTYISLPGRFLVLMPFSDHIGVSRRIEKEVERDRLKQIVQSLRRGNCGYIVRTASEGIAAEKLADEMGFLDKLWEAIQKKEKTLSATTLLHKELNVSLRAVRDLLTNEAEKVVTDSRIVYEDVLSFLDTYMPALKDSVTLYEGPEPIFDAYNLEWDISRALKRKVWMKSGGYIVIDQTEALCAIDVNTGRYVGTHNQDETILKTNLEAVKEIAYQVRLRDIGGIIIIDFIDMVKKLHQEKVFNELLDALKKDRSKTHVLPISELGLVQMTRKRVRQPLHQILCEPCFYCDGQGTLMSRRSICYNIYREMLRQSRDLMGDRLTLRVNPEIADLFYGEERRLVEILEDKFSRQIVIYPNPTYHLEQFDVLEVLDT